jgi:hypothetical protein
MKVQRGKVIVAVMVVLFMGGCGGVTTPATTSDIRRVKPSFTSTSYALTLDQKALVGLEGVQVVVEGPGPEAERLGLSKNQIKTDVERRLRKAGVRVLTNQLEQEETPGTPHLYVKISANINKIGVFAYSINVDLVKIVTRFTGETAFATVWEKGEAGSVGLNNINQIQPRISSLVDSFINDYLAANPKK